MVVEAQKEYKKGAYVNKKGGFPGIPQPKLSPHNEEAESVVIGGLLSFGMQDDTGAVDEVINMLKEDDFYSREKSIIYEKIIKLYNENKNFDIISVYSELEENSGITSSYLADLANSVVFTHSLYNSAQIVKNDSRRRKYIQQAVKIQSLMNEKGNPEDIFDQAQHLMMTVADEDEKKSTIIDSKTSIEEILKRIEANRETKGDDTSIKSDFNDLDDLLVGFRKKNLYILAARPSMGKTAFALNLLRNISKRDVPCAIFSLEMGYEKLSTRLVCAEAGVDSLDVAKGFINQKQMSMLKDAGENLKKCPYYIDDSRNTTEMGIRSKARILKNKFGIEILIVDYIQLVKSASKFYSREQEVAHISSSMFNLASELDIPVVLLGQLNRELEKRNNKRPIMSDLRESGALEQDADGVMFLYRDKVYNPTEENKNKAEIILAKHRDGPTGIVNLHFEEKSGEFNTLTSRYEDL